MKLPPLARPIVRKALRRLGLAEAEHEGFAGESELMSSEMLAELETESEEELEGVQAESMIPEFQTENIISEAEMDSEEETLHESENQVAELLQEFDREHFSFGEAELSHVGETEVTDQEPTQKQLEQPCS